MILDLGCGPNKSPGSTGMDFYAYEGVDIVHGINITPWPIDENSVDQVNAKHIIEHVDSIPEFMREIHRISIPGAKLVIDTPHFTSLDSWKDPTHKWHLSYTFSERFTKGHYLTEQIGEFTIIKRRISFGSLLMSWPARLICGLFGILVWERYSSYLFRARNLYVELIAEK